MSSTWEEPSDGAPTESPSPSDAPTGGEETGKEHPQKRSAIEPEPEPIGTKEGADSPNE